jgi:hypothetical protein
MSNDPLDHIPRPAPQVIGADEPPTAPALKLEPVAKRLTLAHTQALATVTGEDPDESAVCRYARSTARWGPAAIKVLRFLPGQRIREARGWLEVSVEAARLVEEHCDRAA